eukprot:gene13292-15624_t
MASIAPSTASTNAANRQCLKNIKNLPSTFKSKPTNKTVLGDSKRTQVTRTPLVNNGVKKQDQFLFNPSTSFSLSMPKTVQEPVEVYQELLTSDLLMPEKVESTTTEEEEDSVITSSSNESRIVYSANFLLDFRTKFVFPRPAELDIIEESQKEAALLQSSSTPTPPSRHLLSSASKTPLFSSYPSHQLASPYKHPFASPLPAFTTSPFDLLNCSAPPQFRLHPAPLPLPVVMSPLSTSVIGTPFKKQFPVAIVEDKATVADVEAPASTTSDPMEDITDSMTKVMRESNEQRLAMRQRQIDIGKSTIGYQTYTGAVSKRQRRKNDPTTPKKTQLCSKRSWDGQVRKWRRLLHKYDPTPNKLDFDDAQLDKEEQQSSSEDVEMKESAQPMFSIASPYDNLSPESIKA